MATCEYCSEPTERLTYKCSYCGEVFCKSHRVPESHDCSRLSDATSPTSVGQSANAELSHGTTSVEDLGLSELRQRAEAEAEGEPYSVADVGHTVGTSPEPDYDTSPDVAIDGSVKDEESEGEEATSGPSNHTEKGRKWLVAVVAALAVAVTLYLILVVI